MSKAVYIISYFGKGEMREKRVLAHKEQLSFFMNKGYDIFVCSMEYNPEDYQDGVSYIDSPLLPPGEARNVLLKSFYASSYEWAVFADNDSWWKDEGKYNPTGNNIESEIENHHIFKSVDAFSLLDGRVIAYNSILAENQNKIEFKIYPQFRGCCFFLANLKKKHGIEIYFSKEFTRPDGSFIMGEDLGFALTMVSQGMRVFQCQNVVLVEKCTQSSTWASSNKERKTFYDEMARACIKAIPNLKLKNNGSLATRLFYEEHSHPKSIAFSSNSLDFFS